MSNNANQPLTREQIYERIKASSKEQYILDEMIRLGFWRSDKDAPLVPEQLIRRETELTKELTDLLERQRVYQNKQALLKEMRKNRLEESRKKQEENKKLRIQRAQEKAQRWKETSQKDIIYLGEDVSGGLSSKEMNSEKLAKHSLPAYADVTAFAAAMKVTVGQLRFLAFNRQVSKISHYKQFHIAKKTGGKRLISAPMPRLKAAQHWILENILQKVKLHEAAHGFVEKRSIVSNATPHLKAEIVVNIDLKDFFPTVHYPRVKGVFRSLGYSEQIATVLGLICTESITDEITLDGETYFVGGGERHLPQGSPCSPAITNILCRSIDARLNGIAKKLGYTYTRYADDLTFSASGEAVKSVTKLLWGVRKVIKDEGFRIHPDKLRIMRKGAKKEVTGIVVNDKPGIDRAELKRFRALVFQVEKDGPKGKHWNNSRNLLASMRGFANYTAMVDPVKGKPLVERVNKILESNKFKHTIRHPRKKPAIPTPPSTNAPTLKNIDPETVLKKKPWWKLW
jgi:RNA-directed DNA polymerase